MDRVMHFEIPADNVARAKRFYTSVFGWRMDSVPKMNYTMVRTVAVNPKTMLPRKAGAINGGMTKRNSMLRTPSVTITVASIERSLAKVVRAGGKQVSKKQRVGDMGWMAYAKDSEGNVIGLWQS